MNNCEPIKLDIIRIDGGTQPRTRIDIDHVTDLADAKDLPPAVVFYDGTEYWLADGFHRYHAARKRMDKTIECEVRNGTCEDAQWHASGANTQHGLRRSNADKRKAVEMALRAKPDSSDRAIAAHVKVSADLVAEVRMKVHVVVQLSESTVENDDSGSESKKSPTKRIGRDGKRRAIKPAKSEPEAAIAPKPPERPKDGRGKPAEIREVRKAIESVPVFEQLIKDAQALRRGIGALADRAGGEELATGRAKELMVAIEHVIAQLKNCTPYTACPFMPNCETGKCKTCKGKKWVTQQVWNNVPENLRK